MKMQLVTTASTATVWGPAEIYYMPRAEDWQKAYSVDACQYCGNAFTPDKRGRCASCGGPHE